MATKKATATKTDKPVAMDTAKLAPSPEPKVTPDPNGDIDQRMAALLQDHQEMGARPKE